jgi:molybdate transport system substrate-binding protein
MNRLRLALAVVAAVALAGCSSSSSGGSSAGTSASASLSGSITVLAASSLTGTFTAIGAAFEALHPGTKVTFSFGSSGDLAQQIVAGSPADVFAAASPKTMATAAKDAGTPANFATNVLEVATPAGDPAGIESLADVAKPSVKLAVCAATAPCGAIAVTMFTQDKLTVKPVTEEADVKSVLSKVELGEVDAGIVYVTDVKAAGAKVTGIAIPAAQNVVTTYPIAVLTASKQQALAAAFQAYVLSAPGQAVLTAAGFGAP